MTTPIDREYEYRKQRYDSYVKERDGLRVASLKISERYDKWMLVLAGGALALSLTFIEKIAPHPKSWSFVFLLIAWLLLIVSVVLELVALATSQRALTEQVALLDNEYQSYLNSLSVRDATDWTEPAYTPTPVNNEFTVKTRERNTWSLRSFVLGIFFLCAFSAVNLPYQEDRSEMANTPRDRLSKGSFVPPRNVLPPPPPPAPPPEPPPQQPPAQPPAPPQQ